MRLGLVTYNIAKDWDLPTIIERSPRLGYTGVELRTTHMHGVEDTLSSGERADVRRRFADSPLELVGLGTTFEYHALDPAVVRENVEGTKRYAQLAADVGASGIKVRPNGHQEEAGVPRERTLDQIGNALRECGPRRRTAGSRSGWKCTAPWPTPATSAGLWIPQTIRACGFAGTPTRWT